MKLGRPPKKPEDRLSEVIHFRVTKEEKDQLCVKALRAGLSLNEVLRRVLFSRVEKTQ
jgi:predicted HicB family RNase H-like nuclease